jgi:hypothetical protein
MLQQMCSVVRREEPRSIYCLSEGGLKNEPLAIGRDEEPSFEDS